MWKVKKIKCTLQKDEMSSSQLKNDTVIIIVGKNSFLATWNALLFTWIFHPRWPNFYQYQDKEKLYLPPNEMLFKVKENERRMLLSSRIRNGKKSFEYLSIYSYLILSLSFIRSSPFDHPLAGRNVNLVHIM